jgi:hypothetical protein
MTKNFENRKYRLIREILKINREEDLNKLENQVESFRSKDNSDFLEAVKPIRKTVTLEELIAEQNYRPIKKDEFFRKAGELKFEESLEELLAMLD